MNICYFCDNVYNFNILNILLTMLQNVIGENSGKVWRLLNEKGELTFNQIKKELKLKNEEIYLALGWLFREDVIYSCEKDETLYFGCR